MRSATMALALSVLVQTGCASHMTNASSIVSAAGPSPDLVYVRTFDVAPDQCLRGGRYAQEATATTALERAGCATRLRDDVANEIVRELRAKGWVAMRFDSPVPLGRNALIVEGTFQTIESGNAHRRVSIGLGAGKRELAASVSLAYQPVVGARIPMQRFIATERSGKAPGMAQSGAVGALTHRLPVALAAAAALHAVSEAKHSTVDTDARNLARTIVKNVEAVGVSNRWSPREHA